MPAITVIACMSICCNESFVASFLDPCRPAPQRTFPAHAVFTLLPVTENEQNPA